MKEPYCKPIQWNSNLYINTAIIRWWNYNPGLTAVIDDKINNCRLITCRCVLIFQTLVFLIRTENVSDHKELHFLPQKPSSLHPEFCPRNRAISFYLELPALELEQLESITSLKWSERQRKHVSGKKRCNYKSNFEIHNVHKKKSKFKKWIQLSLYKSILIVLFVLHEISSEVFDRVWGPETKRESWTFTFIYWYLEI